MALDLMPKLQVVLKEAMVAQTPIQAFWEGAPRIYFDNVPPNPVWPLWVLTIVDQIPDGPWCHFCRVQVDMYGKDASLDWRDKMKDHARTLEAVVRDLDGDWPAGKLRLVAFDRGLPQPDETGRARQIVDLTMNLYR